MGWNIPDTYPLPYLHVSVCKYLFADEFDTPSQKHEPEASSNGWQ